jgi:hypothetical protein
LHDPRLIHADNPQVPDWDVNCCNDSSFNLLRRWLKFFPAGLIFSKMSLLPHSVGEITHAPVAR